MRFVRLYMVLVLMLLHGLNCAIAGEKVIDNQHQIDSLLKILPLSEQTERFPLLFSLSNLYLTISMDSSREYAKLALQTARELQDTEKMAEAYKLLGNISYLKGEYNHVIGFYDSSLMGYKESNDSFGQAKVLNNLGIVFQHIGDYRKSIDYHLKSLEFKKLLNDSVGIANSYNNIGSIYYDLRNLEKSSEYFTLALEMSEKLGNTKSVPGILNNLGLISQELGNIDKSVQYFTRSINVGELSGDFKAVATAYHNYGKSMFLSGRYMESLEYYNKALELYEKLGIYNSQTLNNLGQLYLELDYYQKAIEYLDRALRYASENNQFVVMREIYQNLAVAYERMGDFEEAYFNYIQFHVYDDSIRNQIYSSRIEELITKNEIEKNREQLEKATLRIEKAESDMQRRNLAIYSVVAGLIGVLIFAIVILRLLRIRGKDNELLKHRNDEILRSQKTIKKINKALTENEATLRSIFDVSPFTIFVINGNGQITDCNDTSMAMFRAKHKRDLLEKNINTFVAQNISGAEGYLMSWIWDNQLSRHQFILKRIDLTSFHAELTSRQIHDNNADSESYIVVISDITERLKFIESLKEAKEKAEESDVLKTAFLTNMSHEIRTPMNSIIGFSNLLNDTKLPEEKRREYLVHILESSNLLLNLIDDIIDISKIEAGQLSFTEEEFYLNELLRERYSSFKEINSEKGIEFRLVLPEESDNIICYTDKLRVKQVLGNLLSNAYKFTHRGYIELGYSLKNENGEPYARIFVKDTGIGIPRAKQEIIFERFRQVDDSRTRNFGGTGLGLAISKRLVELMHGRIWVESTPDKGSVFLFTIPVKVMPTAPVKEVQPHKNGFDWKDKTLLVAEDENSNYELIRATLQSTGVRLIRAVNGEEAIREVKNNHNIDLILMDIRMPKINGYDATRQIKKINSRIPVLSITAYAMSEDESKSIEAGCDSYISKPIKPKKLLEVLNNYL